MLLMMACANMGTPDGGPYDETPPRIVRTSPRYGAGKTHSTRIVLEFDENIKLDNPNDKVVVSPPQLNQPEISAAGRRIVIQLIDSLQPDMTYTIDFADAIEDNNEGNPMGDYAFTFSTGPEVDTFQVSGHVLDASNLEPIKGMLVGLYAISLDRDSLRSDSIPDNIPDSLFRTKMFERISRTDSRGHFIIKGLAQGKYRVFALKDQDQDFRFTQKSEMIAFTDRVLSPYSRPDIRPDTVWHDSIHYDSIIHTPYTHFYPDDIVLLAFKESGQTRSFLKIERPQLEKFSIFFTAPDDTLPRIEGLNFNADDAFVIDANATKDTLTYWIRDSLIYNIDTLNFVLSFHATDTLGQLTEMTDTIALASKISYEKAQKAKRDKWDEYVKEYRKQYKKDMADKRRRSEPTDTPAPADTLVADTTAIDTLQADTLMPDTIVSDTIITDTLVTHTVTPVDTAVDEPEEDTGSGKKGKKKTKKRSKDRDEDIPVPPMPETFLDLSVSKTTIDPDNNVDITITTPIDTLYTSMFHFSETIDSVQVERPFILRRLPGSIYKYRLYAEWRPDTKYELLVDTGAVADIYGLRSAGTKKQISVRDLDSYSTLFVVLQNADTSAIVQLMDGSDKVVKQIKAKNGKADFYFINPGTYYLRMFYDRNGDGIWTSGNYDLQQQGEETYYYPGAFDLKAGWEISQNWNPLSTPVAQQKPGKITKQKPEKEKELKSRNAEREQNKRNGGRTRSSATGGSSGASSGTYGSTVSGSTRMQSGVSR